MWIRSQDKKVLTNVDCLEIRYYDTRKHALDEICIEEENGQYDIIGYNSSERIIFGLGKYSTRTKALKALDMIHDFIAYNEEFINVFKMPQDDEVTE